MLNGNETRGEPKCTACEKAKGMTPHLPSFFPLFFFFFSRAILRKWKWPDIRAWPQEAKSTSGPVSPEASKTRERERERKRERKNRRSVGIVSRGRRIRAKVKTRPFPHTPRILAIHCPFLNNIILSLTCSIHTRAHTYVHTAHTHTYTHTDGKDVN